MKKRMLTWIIVFSLILGIFPVNAFAAQQGTKTRVYTVMICDTTIVRGSRPMEYQVKVNEQFYKTVTGFNDECYMMLLPVDNEMTKNTYRYEYNRGFIKDIGDIRKTLDWEYGIFSHTSSAVLRAKNILDTIQPEPGVNIIKNIVLFSNGKDALETQVRALYHLLPKNIYTYVVGCPAGPATKVFEHERALKGLQNSGYYGVSGVMDHDVAFESVAEKISQTYYRESRKTNPPQNNPVPPSPTPETPTKKGYIVGYPDNTFRPNDYVTRAEAITMISSLLNEPPLDNAQVYNDVPSHFWASKYINAAFSKGILREKRGENFRPHDKMTRAELSYVLANVVPAPKASVELNLKDVRDNWALNSIKVLHDKNIVSGYPDGTFRPDNYVTRAEIVTMLNKSFNLNQGTAHSAQYEPFKDVPYTHWAYKDILIASGR